MVAQLPLFGLGGNQGRPGQVLGTELVDLRLVSNAKTCNDIRNPVLIREMAKVPYRRSPCSPKRFDTSYPSATRPAGAIF